MGRFKNLWLIWKKYVNASKLATKMSQNQIKKFLNPSPYTNNIVY